MDERNELSRVSQKYLTRYREITENMICKMNGADFTDSISQNFINQMIPHHEAANVTKSLAVHNQPALTEFSR